MDLSTASDGTEEAIPVGISAQQFVDWIEMEPCDQGDTQRIPLLTSQDYGCGLVGRGWIAALHDLVPFCLTALVWVLGCAAYAFVSPFELGMSTPAVVYAQIQEEIRKIPLPTSSPNYPHYRRYYLEHYQTYFQTYREAKERWERTPLPTFNWTVFLQGLSIGLFPLAGVLAFYEYQYGTLSMWMEVVDGWLMSLKNWLRSPPRDPLAHMNNQARFLQEFLHEDEALQQLVVGKKKDHQSGEPMDTWGNADELQTPLTVRCRQWFDRASLVLTWPSRVLVMAQRFVSHAGPVPTEADDASEEQRQPVGADTSVDADAVEIMAEMRPGAEEEEDEVAWMMMKEEEEDENVRDENEGVLEQVEMSAERLEDSQEESEDEADSEADQEDSDDGDEESEGQRDHHDDGVAAEDAGEPAIEAADFAVGVFISGGNNAPSVEGEQLSSEEAAVLQVSAPTLGNKARLGADVHRELLLVSDVASMTSIGCISRNFKAMSAQDIGHSMVDPEEVDESTRSGTECSCQRESLADVDHQRADGCPVEIGVQPAACIDAGKDVSEPHCGARHEEEQLVLGPPPGLEQVWRNDPVPCDDVALPSEGRAFVRAQKSLHKPEVEKSTYDMPSDIDALSTSELVALFLQEGLRKELSLRGVRVRANLLRCLRLLHAPPTQASPPSAAEAYVPEVGPACASSACGALSPEAPPFEPLLSEEAMQGQPWRLGPPELEQRGGATPVFHMDDFVLFDLQNVDWQQQCQRHAEALAMAKWHAAMSEAAGETAADVADPTASKRSRRRAISHSVARRRRPS